MIQNVGYKFNRASKKWLGAFMFNAAILAGGGVDASAATASSPTNEQKPHYRLLGLDQINAFQLKAAESGDMQAAVEFRLAAIAIDETNKGLRGSPSELPGDIEAYTYTEGSDGVVFHVIDPSSDVNWTNFTPAMKTAQVKAEKVGPGTVVQTVMADGHIETTKTAGPGGGYRVTNPAGEKYLVDTAKFEKLYDPVEGADGTFKPKPSIRKVLPISENLAFIAPWGEEMRIKAGGVLVHDGIKKVYGIQGPEYNSTYSAVSGPA